MATLPVSFVTPRPQLLLPPAPVEKQVDHLPPIIDLNNQSKLLSYGVDCAYPNVEATGGIYYTQTPTIADWYAQAAPTDWYYPNTASSNGVISNIYYNFRYQVTNPYPNFANYLWKFDDSAVSVSWQAETEEQKVARELSEIKQKAASQRAEDLLLMILPAKQKQQYLEKGYFDTEIGDKIYRINKGWSGNVKLIEKEKTVASFCIHPEEYLPHADNMLAQYLMLRTDEHKFLAKANKTILY